MLFTNSQRNLPGRGRVESKEDWREGGRKGEEKASLPQYETLCAKLHPDLLSLAALPFVNSGFGKSRKKVLQCKVEMI